MLPISLYNYGDDPDVIERDTPMASYDTKFNSITAVKLQKTSLHDYVEWNLYRVKGITIFVQGEKLQLDKRVYINNICIKNIIFVNQTLSLYV